MIDQRVLKPWPEEVVEATAHFKQGTLIESPSFFYVAVTRYAVWEFTRSMGDPTAGQDLFQVEPLDEPRYGLITTQTCDLDEQRDTPRQPWIQVAPVFRVDSILTSDQQRQAKDHNIGHLVVLTAPSLPNGLWAADLRIEFPLEKSCLVGRQPIESFADEAGYLLLARRLAARRDRPALDNAVSEEVVKPLRQDLVKLKRKGIAWLDNVDELRLLVSNGTRLSTKAAQLLVMTCVEPSEPLKDWFNAWYGRIQTQCHTKGLALLGNRYGTLASFSAEDYRTSVPLDFRYLSPDTEDLAS